MEPENNLSCYSNYLLVSGSGKKVGKTYLVTALIRKFSLQFPVVGLKISPHIHDDPGDAVLINHEENRFRIYREYAPHRKNSGQYLEAGASKAFFMETGDENLADAFDYFNRCCNPENSAVICESGALGSIIRPAIHIHISDMQEARSGKNPGWQKKADLILPARDFDPAKVISRISFDERGWTPKGC